MHIAQSSVVLGPARVGARARGGAGRGVLVAAAAASASGALLWSIQQQQRLKLPSLAGGPRHARRKPRVSWLAVDALSGAIGEIASLVVLYPLDSLKVLCQARGASTAAVLAELRALGCSGAALRQLYAGCGSAALCSAAIGAVYLLAFYSAKRLGAAMVATQGAPARAAAAAPPRQQHVSSSSSSSRPQVPASGSQLADGSTRHPPLNSEGTHPLVASLAGVAASLAGSIFEAPMEMFKLRTQAGALDGPMLRSMAREASTRGLGALYATYGAFMLKSIPYDVAELATYSQMCDWRDAEAAGAGGASSAARPGWQRRLGSLLAGMPAGASDMLIGAAAGAASVLVSMPCDVIKTRMDLFPPACPAGAGGLWCSARAFLDTGRQLAAQGGGLHALYVGTAPRLLQTVPSCMVYWAAVEATRRLMQQHFEVEGGDAGGVAVGAAGTAAAPASSGVPMPVPALAQGPALRGMPMPVPSPALA